MGITVTPSKPVILLEPVLTVITLHPTSAARKLPVNGKTLKSNGETDSEITEITPRMK